MTSDDPDVPFGTCLVRVYGRVQGVGYREACVDRARAFGITGWVRNRLDGSVEAMLQGPTDRLLQMRRWLREGPSMASVDDVVVTNVDQPVPRFERFARRPSE
jgi:acylphosphatase